MNRLEKTLLWLLILFIPSQLSFHFWPETSLYSLVRIDYLSIPVYFSDLLAVCLLIVATINRGKNIRGLSSLIRIFVQKLMFRLPLLTTAAIILGILNILMSQFPLLTFHKIVLIGIYSLIFKIYLPRKSALKIVFTSLSVSLVWISLLGIGQFAASKSIGGVFWWLGERPLAINSGSIATINIGRLGYRFIRAYSVFPHPNALAGYLVVSMLILVFIYRKIYPPVLMISLLCLVTTFSFSGSIAAIIFLSAYYFVIFRPVYPKRLLFKIAGLATLLGLTIHFVLRPSSFFDRLLLMAQSLQIIVTHPFFGTGLGAYLVGANNELVNSGSFFQPVHNIYLLISAELGIIQSFLIYFFTSKLIIKNLNSPTIYPFLAIIFLGLLDHYWLTSHANLILLVLTYFLVQRSNAQYQSCPFKNKNDQH